MSVSDNLRADSLGPDPVLLVAEEQQQRPGQNHEETDRDGQDAVGHVHHVVSLASCVLVLLNLKYLESLKLHSVGFSLKCSNMLPATQCL